MFDWFETTNKKKKVKLVSKIDLEKVVGEIQKAYMWGKNKEERWKKLAIWKLIYSKI